MIGRDEWPDRYLTTEEIHRHLFGDPRIRGDDGMLGRVTDRIEKLQLSLDRILRLARAIFIGTFLALLTLIGDLVVALSALGHGRS